MRVVFIHGNGAMNWRFARTPRLKQALQNLNIECIFETFPDSILARSEYRLDYLQNYIKADEDTLLVWRSSGAVAAMRYAEHHKVFWSILVAPSYTDLWLESEKVSWYFNEPREWDSIRKNQKIIHLFYSKNDEFIPVEEFEYIKDKIQPEYNFVSSEWHFMNLQEFPQLLSSIQSITTLVQNK